MILVTGATGTIGSMLLRRLSAAGIPTRALSRNPDSGEPLQHIEWVEADLADPETLPPVFEGVYRLFLLTGNDRSMTALQKNAIDVAAVSGVGHVVKLSARGAQPGSKSAIGRWHHAVETHLKESGLRRCSARTCSCRTFWSRRRAFGKRARSEPPRQTGVSPLSTPATLPTRLSRR